MARPEGYAPPRFNRQPLRLLAVILCVGLFPVVTMQFLVWEWGPPAATPWVEAGGWRVPGALTILLSILLLFSYSWRRSACFLLPLGVFIMITPIYSPLTLGKIFLAAGRTQFVYAALAAGILALWGIGVVRGVRAKKGSVKGTAQWGKARTLRSAQKGFILGRWKGNGLLRYGNEGHLLTVAATRSGKGVGTIIPNLLDHPGSVVCTDPKGENWFVTSPYRKKIREGHKVIPLDPFGITGEPSGGYNPLDTVDMEDPSASEVAMSMAENMIGHADKGEAFWVSEAKAILTMLILYAKSSSDTSRHTLGYVRRIASLELPDFQAVCRNIKENKGHIPGLSEAATRVLQKEPKELSGVMSTLQSRTHVFSSPRLQAAIGGTTFSKEDLLGDNASVYIIVPREHLVAYASWIRTTLTSIYGLITRDAHNRTTKPAHRILFMLDEFANLGRIREMEDAVSLGAGFGISFWLILQDFNQLKKHYDKSWNTFIANADVIQVFGIQDTESCDQIKQLMGETTVWDRKLSKEKDRSVHQEYDEETRPLMTSDEIRRLHPDRQIIFVRPHLPVVARKIKFYQDPAFKHLASPNPYVDD